MFVLIVIYQIHDFCVNNDFRYHSVAVGDYHSYNHYQTFDDSAYEEVAAVVVAHIQNVVEVVSDIADNYNEMMMMIHYIHCNDDFVVAVEEVVVVEEYLKDNKIHLVNVEL
jgi:hypothetical protein